LTSPDIDGIRDRHHHRHRAFTILTSQNQRDHFLDEEQSKKRYYNNRRSKTTKKKQTMMMIATTTGHQILQITKRSLPAAAASVDRMVFSTAAHYYSPQQHPHQHHHAYYHDQPHRPTIEQLIDPLDLDIVSSPEVRRILAQCKSTKVSHQLQQQQEDDQPFFRKSFASFPTTTNKINNNTNFDDDDGYDSDCEPMHDDWESEARDDDGCSIDEKLL
jgi:hypothetical protein